MIFNFSKIFRLAIVLSIFFGLIFIINKTNSKDFTTIQIENLSDNTITAYLTLNDNDASWVSDVNGIFGIKSDEKLQGGVILIPKQILSYTSDKPIAGNISFNDLPLNCPYPAPTLFEFTLNNYGTITKAQETTDISCVYGVTSIGKITYSGGGIWNSGQNDTIRKIQNGSIYKNTGLKGVYPYGCTTCTGRDGMVDCNNKKRYEKVNKKAICNIQRDASESGGNVKISYIR